MFKLTMNWILESILLTYTHILCIFKVSKLLVSDSLKHDYITYPENKRFVVFFFQCIITIKFKTIVLVMNTYKLSIIEIIPHLFFYIKFSEHKTIDVLDNFCLIVRSLSIWSRICQSGINALIYPSFTLKWGVNLFPNEFYSCLFIGWWSRYDSLCRNGCTQTSPPLFLMFLSLARNIFRFCLEQYNIFIVFICLG